MPLQPKHWQPTRVLLVIHGEVVDEDTRLTYNELWDRAEGDNDARYAVRRKLLTLDGIDLSELDKE